MMTTHPRFSFHKSFYWFSGLLATFLCISIPQSFAQGVFADFPVGNDNIYLASTLSPIQVYYSSSLAELKAACLLQDQCIAVALASSSGVGYTLQTGDDVTYIQPGFTNLSWRYNAPSPPTCSSVLGDTFAINGECTCGSYTLEEQDTVFGCTLLAPIPSVEARRRRQRSLFPGKLAPGTTTQPYFLRNRSEARARRAAGTRDATLTALVV